MRALKISLTAAILLGLTGLFCLPMVMRQYPAKHAPTEVRKQFAILITTYSVGLFVVFAIVMILAVRLLRRQQEMYLEATEQNLRELIEGTLADHAKQSTHDRS